MDDLTSEGDERWMARKRPFRRRPTVISMGIVLVAMLIAGLSLASMPTSGATALSMLSAQLQIGSLNYTWHGTEAIDDGHATANGWYLNGGDPESPVIDGLAHVDEFVALDHVTFLLIEVYWPNSDCVITTHGPIVADYIGNSEYGALFTKMQLGGILYTDCTSNEQSFILDTVESGVTVLYEIDHA